MTVVLDMLILSCHGFFIIIEKSDTSSKIILQVVNEAIIILFDLFIPVCDGLTLSRGETVIMTNL